MSLLTFSSVFEPLTLFSIFTFNFALPFRSPVKHYPGSVSHMTFRGEYKLPVLLQVTHPACLPFTCKLLVLFILFRVRDGVAVQHFTFVLTDLEGCQRFGFCRLTNSTHTCLCILRYSVVYLSVSRCQIVF